MNPSVFTEGSPYAADGRTLPGVDRLEKTFANFRWLRDGLPSLGVQRGLFRSHPSATLAASQVVLLDALGILFQDGYYIDSSALRALSAPLTWDLAVLGAGGRDAGSEEASTWYEPYVIATAAGALSTLLHRLPNYAEDQSATSVGTEEPLRSASTQQSLAQGFQPSVTGRVPFVLIRLARIGSPTGNIWVEMQTDASGNPSGVVVSASPKLPVATVQTNSESYLLVPFWPAPTLTAGVQYHLVLQGDYTVSGANYVEWDGTASDVYAHGSAKRYDGATWSAAGASVDLVFKTFVESNVADLDLPSGYTRYARVGVPIRNDGSSNVKRFIAMNRWVRPIATSAPAAWASVDGVATSENSVLIDLSAQVPPGIVALELLASNSGAGGKAFVAPVPDGYAIRSAGATDEGLFGLSLSGRLHASGVLEGLPMSVHVQFQQVYLKADAAGVASVYGRRWKQVTPWM